MNIEEEIRKKFNEEVDRFNELNTGLILFAKVETKVTRLGLLEQDYIFDMVDRLVDRVIKRINEEYKGEYYIDSHKVSFNIEKLFLSSREQEQKTQEEIVKNTVKHWIEKPIEIEANEIEIKKEEDLKLKKYFNSRTKIEHSFYKEFDLLVKKFNDSFYGQWYIVIENIEIDVKPGSKPAEEFE
jgi:hypothetical protein